jgi:hypothetical protein
MQRNIKAIILIGMFAITLAVKTIGVVHTAKLTKPHQLAGPLSGQTAQP